jgi:iron complex transport system ATP-binding protein
VRLGGVPVASLDARALAQRVAVVPQALDGVGAATVEAFVTGGRYAHLGLWGRPRTADRAAVQQALARAEVEEWRGRRLDELSGGQRQRVLVARALAQEAPALLLDEPTAALDPEHQIHLLELVRALARAGSAVAVVTHDLNLTSQFASRVLLLDRGRTAAEGTVEEVLTPEVLEPVYGPRLLFQRFPGSGRPLVVPWSGDGA